MKAQQIQILIKSIIIIVHYEKVMQKHFWLFF